MKSLMATKLLTAIAMITALAADSVGNPAPAIDTAGKKLTKLHVQHCNSTRMVNPIQWMWGDVNPNIYYICDESSNATRQLHCPAGRGFFNGRGHYGCLPYEEWPACLDSNSSSSSDDKSSNAATAELCTDVGHLQETWPAVDPNKFYMCQQANTTPLLLNCEPGKGYVSAWLGGAHEGGDGGGVFLHEGTHIVGCAAWEKWRMYMHCEDFY